MPDPSPSTSANDLTPQELIGLIEDERDRRWAAGDRVPAEEYLAAHSSRLDAELALQLVYGEFLLRERAGETPQVEEYRQRFPALAERLAMQVELHRALAGSEVRGATSNGDTAREGREHDSLPAEVPGFEFLGVIGKGGMGVVFRARDVSLDRDVAVKLLQEKYAPGSLAARRFLDEARITGQLQHPGIPPVHAVDTLPDGRPFLAMKLINGRTLSDILADGSMNRGSMVAAFEHVCQAVGYAHNHGVIHRDLKPQNVMVGAYGEVQVMDWGLARSGARNPDSEISEEKQDRSSDVRKASSADHTLPGSILGTPAYMAPEQAAGATEEVDERADVFGLGAILCAILTGRPPFVGDTAETTRLLAARGKVSAAFARLDECGAEPELVSLCKRCLDPEKAARPRNAGEVATAVQQFRAESEERARRAELERARAEVAVAEQRKRRRVQLALAGCVLLLVSAIGLGAWQAQRVAGERKTEALERQIQDESRAAAERERLKLNGASVEPLLKQTEDALRAGDARTARIVLEPAEQKATEGGAEHMAVRLARCRIDLNMLREIDRINEYRWSGVRGEYWGFKQVEAEWSAAFARFGIVPGETSPADAARKVNESHVKDQLLAALDLWLAASHSRDVLAILRAADPHPYRDLVREHIAAKDYRSADAVSNSPAALEQPGRFAAIFVVLGTLPVERRVRPLLAALDRKPGDFGLLMTLGGIYQVDTAETANEREKWYRAAVAVRPASAAARCNLGIALRDKKDFDGAIAACRAAIELDRNDPRIHCNLGLVLHDKGDFDAAIVAFADAIRLEPRFAAALTNLGVTLFAKNEKAAAIAKYREALRIDPSLAIAHFNLGIALHADGRADEAIREYREAIRLDPTRAVVHSSLGALLMERKQFDEAIVSLKEAVRLDPGLVAAYVNLGNVLIQTGHPDEAIVLLKEAVRRDPKLAKAHTNLGAALFVKRDWPGSIAAHRRAIELEPELAVAHAGLGQTLLATGKVDEAIKAFQEAIRLDRDFASAYNGLGSALRARKDVDGMLKAFEEAVRLAPTNALFHSNLGSAWMAKRDFARAIAEYEQAVRINPKYSSAFENLGLACYSEGDMPGAIRAYKSAAVLVPNDSTIRVNLGNALFVNREVDAAIAEYREAIRIAPSYSYAYSRLGIALDTKGLMDESVVAFTDALKYDPDNPERKKNLQVAQQRKAAWDAAAKIAPPPREVKP